jgi:hypothetical protein
MAEPHKPAKVAAQEDPRSAQMQMVDYPARHSDRGRFWIILSRVTFWCAVLSTLTVGLLSLSFYRERDRTGLDVTTSIEIGQMEQGLAAAMLELGGGLSYLPSYLVLKEDGQYDPNDPDQVATFNILLKTFGKRITAGACTTWPIDWNGNGVPNETLVLQGQHCLVFWLGGIPNKAADDRGNVIYSFIGFSNNPTNPAHTLSQARLGPYYPFKTARLRMDPKTGFLYYVDLYNTNQPYAYFSTGKGGFFLQTHRGQTARGDCPGLGLVPYYQGSVEAPKFMNPTGFQIISAGEDGKFGAGGLWDPATGARGPDGDNISNFARGLLRTPSRAQNIEEQAGREL